MPVKETKGKILYLVVSVFLVFTLFISFLLISDFEFKNFFSVKIINIKDSIATIFNKDYVIDKNSEDTVVVFNPPGLIELSEDEINIKTDSINIISSGELENTQIKDTGGNVIARASVLNVDLLDIDGNRVGDSFKIVVSIKKIDNKEELMAGFHRTLLHQDKFFSKASAYDGDVNNLVSEIEVSDNEVEKVDLSQLLAKGKQFKVIPYRKESVVQHLNYIESNSEIKMLFPNEYFEYYEIVDMQSRKNNELMFLII